MQLVSSLPGRARFREAALLGNRPLCRYLAWYLDSTRGVVCSTVNRFTSSILVTYDITLLSRRDIEENILFALKSAARGGQLPELYEPYCRVLEKRDMARNTFLVYGALFMFSELKRRIYGKFPLSMNVTALKTAALVSIIGGYPLLRGTYDKCLRRAPFDSGKLLSFSSVLMTLLRESSEGIFVLMMKALNDYNLLKADVYAQKITGCVMGDSFVINPFNSPENTGSHLNRLLGKIQSAAAPAAFGASGLGWLSSGSSMGALPVMLLLATSGAATALDSAFRNYKVLLHKNGLYLKSPAKLEAIAAVTHIVVDAAELEAPGSSTARPSSEGLGELFKRLEYLDIVKVTVDRGNGLSSLADQICAFKGEGDRVLLVGGRLTDTAALREADASVCVSDGGDGGNWPDADCYAFGGDAACVAELIYLSRKCVQAAAQSMGTSGMYNALLGTAAFFGHIDAFSAKALNSLNSAIVLVINKRMEYFSSFSGRRSDPSKKLLNP